MAKSQVDVTDAKCFNCGSKVDPQASFEGSGQGERFTIFPHIYTYWHCDKCGATQAMVNGTEYSYDPIDLFKKREVKLRDHRIH